MVEVRANLITAVLYREEEVYRRAVDELARLWGEVDFAGPPRPFTATDYYAGEMGEGLVRRIVSFGPLVDPSRLPGFKRESSRVEDLFREGGKRRVNLDPGYLDFHKVVLASWKERGNKIYMGEGVWADVILFFHRGRVIPTEWSFPDFRCGTYDSELLEIRRRYREKMRGSLRG
ncbi:MAG: DUF4416 family protein [Deltaproteobacteria bacterium]|nr:MAG: DUF4416 family protein [Deltaproteobacteria bacterium]